MGELKRFEFNNPFDLVESEDGKLTWHYEAQVKIDKLKSVIKDLELVKQLAENKIIRYEQKISDYRFEYDHLKGSAKDQLQARKFDVQRIERHVDLLIPAGEKIASLLSAGMSADKFDNTYGNEVLGGWINAMDGREPDKPKQEYTCPYCDGLGCTRCTHPTTEGGWLGGFGGPS